MPMTTLTCEHLTAGEFQERLTAAQPGPVIVCATGFLAEDIHCAFLNKDSGAAELNTLAKLALKASGQGRGIPDTAAHWAKAIRIPSAKTQWEMTMIGHKRLARKEFSQIYGGRKPKSYKLAHNHIAHTDLTRHGERGFRRFWIPPQWIGHGWSKCPCGWHNGDTHYAQGDHVKRWHQRIKRCGSLEAAYREIERDLAAEFPFYKQLLRAGVPPVGQRGDRQRKASSGPRRNS
jgi:hypothetical protein